MTDTATPYDADLETPLEDEVEPVDAAEPSPVGRLVKVTHEDPRNPGTDVVQFGTVVEESAAGVLVGLFPAVVGPLPLDHTCHERDDAPRVEFVDMDDTSADELVRALTGG